MNKHIKRRQFLSWLGFAPIAVTATSNRSEKAKPLLLQQSPLAGFQFHNGEENWSALKVQGELQLIVEPENKYDQRAVAVYWQQQKLGYIPRQDNAAVFQLLQRGETVKAQINSLVLSANPWRRVSLQIWVWSH